MYCKNNGVVLSDCIGDECVKVKATIEKSMPLKKMLLRIGIANIGYSNENEEIINKSRIQNPVLKDGLLKVIRNNEVKKDNQPKRIRPTTM